MFVNSTIGKRVDKYFDKYKVFKIRHIYNGQIWPNKISIWKFVSETLKIENQTIFFTMLNIIFQSSNKKVSLPSWNNAFSNRTIDDTFFYNTKFSLSCRNVKKKYAKICILKYYFGFWRIINIRTFGKSARVFSREFFRRIIYYLFSNKCLFV